MADIDTQLDEHIGARDKSGQWQPLQLPKPAPVFSWPPRPKEAFKWLFGFPGYLWPWNMMYMVLAIGTWLYLQPELASLNNSQK